MREAQEKLSAAEEASRLAAEEAKKKAREIKTSVGLARPIGPKVPAFVTHRGHGAFNELDFVKKEKLKEIMKEREERKLQNHQEIDSDKVSEVPSSDGCDSLKATEETTVNDATDSGETNVDKNQDEITVKETKDCCNDEIIENNESTLEPEINDDID